MTTLIPTLSNRLFPRVNPHLRDLTLIVTGSLFIALLAHVKIVLPFTPVPITGQTFAVLLIGALLGSKRGAATVMLYIAEGLLGLPFFAGGGAGLAYLFGATGGYLLGFVVSAYLVGKLCEGGMERHWRTALVPFLSGTLMIYFIGAIWLAVFVGWQNAFMLGVLPFILGDAIKVILAALVLPGLWRLIR